MMMMMVIMVDLYRVFWRPVGSRTANKTDTITPKVVLTELTPGVTYEVDIYYHYLLFIIIVYYLCKVVVKAGNSEGTSQLTAPVKFYTVRHWSLIADQVTMIHYSRLTNSSSPAPPGTRTSGAQWASCSPSSSSSVRCLNQFCTVQCSSVLVYRAFYQLLEC